MRDDGHVSGLLHGHAREDGDEEVDPGEVPPDPDEVPEEAVGEAVGRWPSWVLVVTCVVPPLVLAEAARRVLGGDYDEEFYGGYPSGAGAFDGAAPEISTGRRFGVLWALVGAPAPLTGGIVAALLALAVVLTGRPAGLLPDRWGRRIAAGGSFLSAALALGCLVGVVQNATAPADEAGPGALRFFLRTGLPDDFPAVAGALAVLVPALVVPAVAGVVLWRGPRSGLLTDLGFTAPAARPPTAERHAVLEAPAAQRVPPRAPEPVAQSAPAPAPDQAAPDQAAIPAVPEADRHLYRRPG